MNRARQPRPLVVLGLNVWMGTAAGADEETAFPDFIQGPSGFRIASLVSNVNRIVKSQQTMF